MGAEIFSTYQSGKDVAQAFREAVNAAAWEHGHGGYTGTLAEKDDYVVIGGDGAELQPRMNWTRLEVEWPDATPVSLGQAQATADRLLDEADPRVDDKWGPAGAIAVGSGGKVEGWLFFGWASS